MPAPVHARSRYGAALLAAAGVVGIGHGADQPAAGVTTPAPAAAPASVAVAAPLQPERHLCADAAEPVALGSVQWNGWGRDLDNTRYQPEPAIRAADVPKLALKWAFGYQGSAVAGQPTLVDGRVFVASAVGRIYALDAKTGCTYWTYDAAAGVHTAMSIGEFAPPKVAQPPKLKSKHKRTLAHLDVKKAPSAVFFGDEHGAVYALDAQRGTLLWKTQVDTHPSAEIDAAPAVYQDRLYVGVATSETGRDAGSACCTFRGSLASLDIASGRIVWKSYTIAEESHGSSTSAGVPAAGVPISAAPTIDPGRGAVYVATGSASTPAAQPLADAVVAFSLSDGSLRWAKQPARVAGVAGAFDAAPILRTLSTGKQMIFVGQRSGIVYCLDPDHGGDILWQTPVAEGNVAGGIVWGPAADHRSLYVPLSGLTVEPADMSGSLTAIDLKVGGKRWQTIAPAAVCAWGPRGCPHGQAQAVTVIPGAAFSGSMDGHLRAYSTIDGKILWDFDTAQDFAAINGIKASGGSLDRGGATIVNGVVYVNSGYGARAGQPGNVLLAFSVDGK